MRILNILCSLVRFDLATAVCAS